MHKRVGGYLLLAAPALGSYKHAAAHGHIHPPTAQKQHLQGLFTPPKSHQNTHSCGLEATPVVFVHNPLPSKPHHMADPPVA
jgi:hypothetical protein